MPSAGAPALGGAGPRVSQTQDLPCYSQMNMALSALSDAHAA